MKDVQNGNDKRGIAIQRVGIRGLSLPVMVKDKADGIQHTIGVFNASVSLSENIKGTHMSRFVQYFSSIDEPLSLKLLSMTIMPEIIRKLDAKSGYVKVKFPYFIKVEAPVSKMYSFVKVGVEFEADDDDLTLTVHTPVTTLCPCSKEISKYGAHNQRGVVSISVKCDGWVWIEEIVDIANKAGSCPIYPLLKRPDEKFVTEAAYDNPRFVEDVVREAKILLERHPQVNYYKVEATNYESIHTHDAYAMVEGHKYKGSKNFDS